MSQHTNGPWIVSDWTILEKEGGTVICEVLPWDTLGSRPEDLANCNLISAAPDMLIALNAVLECASVTDQWWIDLVKNAVEKADPDLVRT